MEKQLMPNASPRERLEILQANAFRMQEGFSYVRELEQSEIEERQNMLSQSLIKIDAEDEILANAREAHKAVVNPLKQGMKQTLREIKTRSEEVIGTVYMLRDEESQRVGIYSPDGLLISERGLLPEERQYSITEQLRKIN